VTPSEREKERNKLTSYAREQHELANLQLDERYDYDNSETARTLHVQTSVAHSLAAITALLLAKETE